jgi:hypothetical protein
MSKQFGILDYSSGNYVNYTSHIVIENLVSIRLVRLVARMMETIHAQLQFGYVSEKCYLKTEK